MDFKGVRFTCSPVLAEILIAELSLLGFQSFSEEDSGFTAFLEEGVEIPSRELEDLLAKYSGSEDPIEFIAITQAKENWNEIWENSFNPVVVDDFCLVRAPFHKVQEPTKLEIIIEPKMSFGTGHHASTFLMLSAMRNIDFKARDVLDIGCGTAILAIAASKLGARRIVAIDIEEWAAENAMENAERNSCRNIDVIHGDHEKIEGSFDVIFANINMNVLIYNLGLYARHLNTNGSLLLSGFYEKDAKKLSSMAQALQLQLKDQKMKDNWVMLHLVKSF